MEAIIMKSQDYEMFVFFNSNRPIKEKNVKRIIDSISRIGYQKSEPILIDKDFKIIDGQHRFEACKRLNIPIYYIEVEAGADITLIRTMLNSNQAKWELWDYVVSWAKEGIECYKELVRFKETYKYTNSTCIIIVSKSNGSVFIRKGLNFTLNENRFEIVKFIEWAEQYVDFSKHKYFIEALITVFNNLDIETIEMLKNEKVFLVLITQQGTVENYLRCFENILNRQIKSKYKKVKLV